MDNKYTLIPKRQVSVECNFVKGEFEGWRHTIGHGGINKYPLPPRVEKGLGLLKPRLVRTFIQEYFNIYPEHNTYDWSVLDPYMESLATTGGKVVASICIKPKVLYPEIDENIVMPNNIDEWQQIIETLVRRYSVEKEIVTYWEIGNEYDIGEIGGCPYKCAEPEQYNQYYLITQQAVLRAFPEAKVGGPAVAYSRSSLTEGLVKFCKESDLQLDFISWHKYSSDPDVHSRDVVWAREMLGKYYGDNIPEMMVTEMSCGFEKVFCEEMAYESMRPATIATSVFDMMDEKLDWSFYYHIWDQVFIAEQFEDFYKDPDIMQIHWNEIPHRFGLFGVCGEVRPTYFFYKMLLMMEGNELDTKSDNSSLRIKSAVDSKGTYRAMLVNYDIDKEEDVIAEIDFNGINDGLKLLSIYRIDYNMNWNEDSLELEAVERRYIDVKAKYSKRPFYTQSFCPRNSVTMIVIEETTEKEMVSKFE